MDADTLKEADDSTTLLRIRDHILQERIAGHATGLSQLDSTCAHAADYFLQESGTHLRDG